MTTTAPVPNTDGPALAPHAPPLVPPGAGAEPLGSDDALGKFLAYVAATGLELYPAQEESLLELWAGKHVVLSTPTGSGKSLVAAGLAWKALCEGATLFYTCP